MYGVGDFYCGAVFGGGRELETIRVVAIDENFAGVWGVLFRSVYKY